MVVSIDVSIVCMDDFVLIFVKSIMQFHILIMDSILDKVLIAFASLSLLLMVVDDARCSKYFAWYSPACSSIF